MELSNAARWEIDLSPAVDTVPPAGPCDVSFGSFSRLVLLSLVAPGIVLPGILDIAYTAREPASDEHAGNRLPVEGVRGASSSTIAPSSNLVRSSHARMRASSTCSRGPCVKLRYASSVSIIRLIHTATDSVLASISVASSTGSTDASFDIRRTRWRPASTSPATTDSPIPCSSMPTKSATA